MPNQERQKPKNDRTASECRPKGKARAFGSFELIRYSKRKRSNLNGSFRFLVVRGKQHNIGNAITGGRFRFISRTPKGHQPEQVLVQFW